MLASTEAHHTVGEWASVEEFLAALARDERDSVNGRFDLRSPAAVIRMVKADSDRRRLSRQQILVDMAVAYAEKNLAAGDPEVGSGL